MQGVRQDGGPFSEVMWGVLPYAALMLVFTGIMIAFPGLVLWLPQTMFGN